MKVRVAKTMVLIYKEMIDRELERTKEEISQELRGVFDYIQNVKLPHMYNSLIDPSMIAYELEVLNRMIGLKVPLDGLELEAIKQNVLQFKVDYRSEIEEFGLKDAEAGYNILNEVV